MMPYRLALAFSAVLVANPASAHGQAEDPKTVAGSLFSGMAHPVLGFDHLLAMVAVGILATRMRRADSWLIPAVFVAVMAVGAGLGFLRVPFIGTELGIAVSVAFLGLAILWAKIAKTWMLYGVVATFALFHGYAHGAEIPRFASAAAYAAGFMTGTAGLHVFGLLIGDLMKYARGAPQPVQVASVFLMGCGVVFAALALTA